MEKEIWKDVENYIGEYQISNYGNVRSLKGNKVRVLKPRAIGPKENNKYLDIEFHRSKSRKHFKVHRLVAIHFVNNPRSLNVINHIDGNNFNNHYLNLEWTTTIENGCHGSRRRNTSSDYIGVSWCNDQNKWKAQINIKGLKNKNLGRFNTEIEAYQARCDFEKENNITNRYL